MVGDGDAAMTEAGELGKRGRRVNYRQGNWVGGAEEHGLRGGREWDYGR